MINNNYNVKKLKMILNGAKAKKKDYKVLIKELKEHGYGKLLEWLKDTNIDIIKFVSKYANIDINDIYFLMFISDLKMERIKI